MKKILWKLILVILAILMKQKTNKENMCCLSSLLVMHSTDTAIIINEIFSETTGRSAN